MRKFTLYYKMKKCGVKIFVTEPVLSPYVVRTRTVRRAQRGHLVLPH
jgi:hypothetical protein